MFHKKKTSSYSDTVDGGKAIDINPPAEEDEEEEEKLHRRVYGSNLSERQPRMESPELTFTFAYVVFAFCFVFTPNEFRSAGLTVQNLFSSSLGSEDVGFTQYHIKRTSITVLVHSALPLGITDSPTDITTWIEPSQNCQTTDTAAKDTEQASGRHSTQFTSSSTSAVLDKLSLNNLRGGVAGVTVTC